MSTFLERIWESAGELELPSHVRGELERYLRCGLLSEGFVRVYCPTCKDDLLVAVSSRGHGVCPSCTGRRMADTAARWVDRVLPQVSWRQWVLTVPFELRLWRAWDQTVVDPFNASDLTQWDLQLEWEGESIDGAPACGRVEPAPAAGWWVLAVLLLRRRRA